MDVLNHAKKKPLALVTNDDGFNSPGLLALAEALEPLFELLIVAPIVQQTNMGRGSLRGEQIGRIEKKMMVINGNETSVYAVHGSPAQAVAHGILELTNQKPDICISGINYGENLGLAFTCSGTLGAIFEADSFGIPGIAFSRAIPMTDQRSDEFGVLSWINEQHHVTRLCQEMLTYGMPEGVRLLNVNFPRRLEPATEVRLTSQADISYGRYLDPDPRNMDQGYQLGWAMNDQIYGVEKDTDIYAVHFDQVVSVTPLTTKMSVKTDFYTNRK